MKILWNKLFRPETKHDIRAIVAEWFLLMALRTAPKPEVLAIASFIQDYADSFGLKRS